MMNLLPLIHLTYLALAVAMTVWVAKTLFRHGDPFLLDAFDGNETIARAVNHLLVVGFYLLNLGFILLFLKYGERPQDLIVAIEYTATKLGVVMLVLGFMHLFNVHCFTKVRQTKKAAEEV